MEFGEPNFGADPEFVAVALKTGKIVRPHNVINDPDPHGREGMATAIGVDGARETSSIELRPGISESGEDLVNRMADLIQQLVKHWKPKSIGYRAGAWVAPEPLGGHIHLGWNNVGVFGTRAYNNRSWQVTEVLSGWQVMNNQLVRALFVDAEVQERMRYATRNRLDYGMPLATRPQGGIPAAMLENHIEFRCPPSWLHTPEAAYCFLGGAEMIAKEVFVGKIGQEWDWDSYVRRMFSDPGCSPPNSPPLSEAYRVAQKYVNVPDFSITWVA
jgi:hypothetical protein